MIAFSLTWGARLRSAVGAYELVAAGDRLFPNPAAVEAARFEVVAAIDRALARRVLEHEVDRVLARLVAERETAGQAP